MQANIAIYSNSELHYCLKKTSFKAASVVIGKEDDREGDGESSSVTGDGERTSLTGPVYKSTRQSA